MIDNLVKAGVKEGLIREENVFLQRAALETQLSVYFMYCIATEKKMELDLEPGILRGYVYQNILKLLEQKSSWQILHELLWWKKIQKGDEKEEYTQTPEREWHSPAERCHQNMLCGR